MRTQEQITSDIRALGRPMHPGVASVTNPKLIIAWRAERDAWRIANPGAEERHALLCEEREAVELAQDRARQQAKRAEAWATDIGVPGLVRRALVAPDRNDALSAIDAWVAGPKPWLVIAGGTGTGKSVAAGYGLARLLGMRRRGGWVDSASFASRVGGFDGQTELRRLQSLDALVVDDFGTEHYSSFTEALFFEVLAGRHEHGDLRTILTTNLDRAALRHRLGSRLADRVSNACSMVTCTGESLRKGAS